MEHRRLSSFLVQTSSLVGTALLVGGLLVCAPRPASAQAIRDFGGLGNTLNGDDNSTSINLGFAATMYGNNVSTLDLDTNGRLSLGGGSDFRPDPLVGLGFSVIAPFWTDSDPSDAESLNPVRFDQVMLGGRNAFAADWIGIPTFGGGPAERNSFQVVIIDRSDRNPGDFDIEFNYNQIQSDTGTFGLVQIPRVGVSDGSADPTHTVEISGSGANDQLRDGDPQALTADSNVGLDGRYLFQVINGVIFFGEQAIGTIGPPSVVAALGGTGTPNQSSTAQYIDALGADNPSQEILDLITDLAALGPGGLRDALDQLNPEHYLSNINATLHSSHAFLNSLFSCPQNAASAALATEGQCYWARASGRQLNWDRTNDNIGGEEDAWGFEAGVQVAVNNNWHVGIGGGFEHTDQTTNNGARTQGERFHGGIIVKGQWGPATLGLAGFIGHADLETKRQIALLGVTAIGDQDISYGGGQMRLAYAIDMGGWYVKPMVDGNATRVELGSIRETGAGALNLLISGQDEWILSVSPAVEFGTQVQVAQGGIARPFIRAGVSWFNNTDFTITSTFQGAPAGAQAFQVTSDFDNVFATLSAGVDLISDEGIALKIGYDGRYSDSIQHHGANAKVSIGF